MTRAEELWAALWRCQTGSGLPGDWETVVRLTAEKASDDGDDNE